jgi:hypothetical protein
VLSASEYRYRKYEHVKKFNKELASGTIKIALKYNVPPAAILAIASVESGYGRGYVAKITGNILSLGAKKGEKELPALYLPSIKKPFKILYNPTEISKYKKNELIYKKRAKSLKKDYRPLPYAGTSKYLDYFDKNPKERLKANLACIEDFCRDWINKNYRFKPFKKARHDLTKRVKEKGKEALFTDKTAIEFINNIGGKPNSFNYRQTWPKKVISVMNNTGLIELMKEIKKGKNFNEAWKS